MRRYCFLRENIARYRQVLVVTELVISEAHCRQNYALGEKIRNPTLAAFVLQAKYSPNANMFVTASKDGDIKIWDGVSNKCVNTFTKSHDGEEVCSVEFSRNSKVRKENFSGTFI